MILVMLTTMNRIWKTWTVVTDMLVSCQYFHIKFQIILPLSPSSDFINLKTERFENLFSGAVDGMMAFVHNNFNLITSHNN